MLGSVGFRIGMKNVREKVNSCQTVKRKSVLCNPVDVKERVEKIDKYFGKDLTKV